MRLGDRCGRRHVEGKNVNDRIIVPCEWCDPNKTKRAPIPKDCPTRATDILEIVDTDVLGPVVSESIGGHKYAIDSFSRYAKIYFLKSRH